MTASVSFPRGVADPQGRAGYIANAAGGIDAFDLQAGTLLWSSDAGARPLLTFDDRLAALAAVEGRRNAFRIVILDTHSGRVSLTADPFELPEWVTVGADGELGHPPTKVRLTVRSTRSSGWARPSSAPRTEEECSKSTFPSGLD